MKLTLAESALDDLQAIMDWYKKEKVPEVGKRLVEDVLRKTEQIEQHPYSGRMVPEFQNPDLRELIHSPFRVIYLIESDSCYLIRVWRSERLLSLDDFFDSEEQVTSDFMTERVDPPA